MAVLTGIGTKFQYYDSDEFPFAEIWNPDGLRGIKLVSTALGNEDITFKATGSSSATAITVDVVGNAITVTYVLEHGEYETSTIANVVTAISGDTDASLLVTPTALGDGSKEMFDIGLTPLEKYVSIAQVTNINGPNMTKETIDSTALDTLGGYKTFITGLKDAGTLTFTLMFDAEYYGVLKGFYESSATQEFRITLPDKVGVDGHGSQFVFDGLVTGLPLTITAEDKITCDVTVQLVGVMTFTPAT